MSIMPGVQNPHCRPCSSLKPSWTGCSSLGQPRPSTVVSSWPSVWTPNSVHDFTGRPSSSTVQAPQPVVSQPRCVPVRPRISLIMWTHRMRGSTSTMRGSPLTVTVICLTST